MDARYTGVYFFVFLSKKDTFKNFEGVNLFYVIIMNAFLFLKDALSIFVT